MVSQVDEAFFFNSIVCDHHVYKTVNVDSAEGWGDCRPLVAHSSTTICAKLEQDAFSHIPCNLS